MEGADELHSTLIQSIERLHLQGRLSDEAQQALKAKVADEDLNVIQVYLSYKEHEDLTLMEEELIEQLAKPIRKRPTGLEVGGQRGLESAEDSSPLGNFLNRRKKEHTAEHHEPQRSMMQPIKAYEEH
jgi:hypothetical protein